nr:hypothetical protein Iba_chr02cCG13920 [Ipomoea batatas]
MPFKNLYARAVGSITAMASEPKRRKIESETSRRVEFNKGLLKLFERRFDLLENHVTIKKCLLSRGNWQNLSR